MTTFLSFFLILLSGTIGGVAYYRHRREVQIREMTRSEVLERLRELAWIKE